MWQAVGVDDGDGGQAWLLDDDGMAGIVGMMNGQTLVGSVSDDGRGTITWAPTDCPLLRCAGLAHDKVF